MNIKVDFDNIVVKEDKNDFNVKVLMLKGEKGDKGDGEANVIEKVQVNGTNLPITNKTVNVPVPVVDSSINSSSTNPVQNSAIYNALSNKVDNSALNNYYEISEVDGFLNNKADVSIVDKKPYFFDNVASMKAYSLSEGDYAITKGYYSANDGGHGEYMIVNDNELIEDNGSIHTLTNGLKAVLIIDEKVNILNFGYTLEQISFDNRTATAKNITNSLENAINYLVSSETAKGTSGGLIGIQIYFPDDIYYIDDTIDLDNNDISLLGASQPIKRVDYRIGNYRQKILTNVDGHVFTNGKLYIKGLNFENILNSGTNDCNFTNTNIKNIEYCQINNYDIVINSNVQFVATITNNFFLNCKKSFIKGNISDAIITNNYINAEREQGNITTGIDASTIGMSTINGNFFDFWTYCISISTQCEEGRIIDNTFDYAYRCVKGGGFKGTIISNNSFNHISNSYNGTMLHYASGTDQSSNDWYCIETLHSIKSLIVSNNTIENYDKFITIPHIASDSSIICSENSMIDFTKYGSIYKDYPSENVKIYDLNEKEYLSEPTRFTTYVGQKVLYNGVWFRNIGNNIYSVGLKSLDNEYNKSYTSQGAGNYTIDLSNILNGALYTNMILEIKTTKNYYSLKTALYKIYRIGSTAYAMCLFDNTEAELKPTITNTNTTLNITMSGTYEESSSSKQVTYRIYEQ